MFFVFVWTNWHYFLLVVYNGSYGRMIIIFIILALNVVSYASYISDTFGNPVKT